MIRTVKCVAVGGRTTTQHHKGLGIEAPGLAYRMARFLGRHRSDGTGIDDGYIGRLAPRHDSIAMGGEIGRQQCAVSLIQTTAESLDGNTQ